MTNELTSSHICAFLSQLQSVAHPKGGLASKPSNNFTFVLVNIKKKKLLKYTDYYVFESKEK